jgi:hypothetical protein
MLQSARNKKADSEDEDDDEDDDQDDDDDDDQPLVRYSPIFPSMK